MLGQALGPSLSILLNTHQLLKKENRPMITLIKKVKAVFKPTSVTSISKTFSDMVEDLEVIRDREDQAMVAAISEYDRAQEERNAAIKFQANLESLLGRS